MTITEFLTARLDEDESVARDALDDLNLDGDGSEWTTGHFDHTMTSNPSALFTRSRSPEQALAEVAAKRKMIVRARTYASQLEAEKARGADLAEVLPRWSEWDMAMRYLASVYADHPDYDPAWRA